MPNFNVQKPDQISYDDDIEEITSLRGELKQALARIERLEKIRSTSTTQTIVSTAGGGSSGTGTPGPKGDPGDTGPEGPTGPAGADGAGDNYTLELEGFPGSPSGIVDILRFTAAFVLNNMGDSLTGEGRLRVEIDLANLGVAGTYDLGGGASVTLDDYGRITAITPVL